MFLLAHTGITMGAVWLISHVDKGAHFKTANAVPLAVLGANLPDIIDKPIGIFVPELGLGTGRGIAHTLAFNLVLLGLGLSGLGGLLYVAVASIGHLVLDNMWRLPRVLFWPFFGFSFPTGRRRGFRKQVLAWWHTLWAHPQWYVTEIAGTVVILAYVLKSLRIWL